MLEDHWVIIVNPVAGRGRAVDMARDLMVNLKTRSNSVEMMLTEALDCSALRAMPKAGTDSVVVLPGLVGSATVISTGFPYTPTASPLSA